MKIPLEWIRQYAPIPVSPEEYAGLMTLRGTAVESVERPGLKMQGVVVGRVLSVRPHENSDHLKVCMVDVGKESPLQIVCGAPNVQEGILAPAALPGARLPGGRRLEKGRIRGVESFGMLCSARELEIPEELYPSVGAEGLLIFQEDLLPGTSVSAFFGLDDAVADFEILADRPDCLSVLGLARETAAVLGTGFTAPERGFQESGERFDDLARVTVEEPELCPRYCARVVTRVRVGPSPLWLRRRLHLCGVRPINNIVDITNYVMLETGHPMHAFDLSRVRDRHILVRRARPYEALTTLDGKTHRLAGGELLICDGRGPTGLAGIMGGLESEITGETREVLLECAAFDRTHTRLTARALGIRTESGGRFEKGVAPATAMAAMERACHLIDLLKAGSVAAGAADFYPVPAPPVTVTASSGRIARRIGLPLDAREMASLLERLCFGVSLSREELQITVPPYRQDIHTEADLSEEVLRMAGYEHIPSTRLRGETPQGGDSKSRRLKRRVAGVLHALGYFESMSFSFLSQGQLDGLNLPEDDPRRSPVRIRNPLGEDTALLRSTLVPGMLRVLQTNQSRGASLARLYEFGTVFDGTVGTPEGLVGEEACLCLGAYGGGADFYSLRDALLALCAREGAPCLVEAGCEPYHHPGRRALLLCGGGPIASVGELHPDIAERFGLSGRCFVAELRLGALARLGSPMGTVKSLPRMPAAQRDLALVLAEEHPLLPVQEAIRQAAGPLLEEVSLFDVYRGAPVPAGHKSAAFSLVFRHSERTLEDQEVARAMEEVLAAVAERFGARLRA